MKMILLSCCSQVANWQEVINTIPCLLWGVIGLVTLWLLLKYVAKSLIQNCNDAKVRKEKFAREKEWQEKMEKMKNDELQRKIEEFEKYTVRQKLLDKVLDAAKDTDFKDMKSQLDELKKRFESLDGEIEQIIIKKK